MCVPSNLKLDLGLSMEVLLHLCTSHTLFGLVPYDPLRSETLLATAHVIRRPCLTVACTCDLCVDERRAVLGGGCAICLPPAGAPTR